MIIEELNKILEAHQLWLQDKKGGSRADLSGANLRGADLSGADLSRANLSRANLSGADLSGANLSGADLSRANLRRANLSRADLRRANLSRADLSRANLSGADLSGANLRRADLDKRYIQISRIGSRLDTTTYCFDDDQVWCGCFSGTLDEFEAKCRKTHANHPQYLAEYLGAIGYLRSLAAPKTDASAEPECAENHCFRG